VRRRVGQVLRAPLPRVFSIHRPLRTNRHVAALLSALWPGLGQLAVGARRTGVLLALPPVILIALIIGALVSPDRMSRLALVLDPNVITAILVAEGVLVLWRIVAVADTWSALTAKGGPLLSHADARHAGNLQRIRRETGARLMVAEGDVAALARGEAFPLVDVDQTIRAGDRVALGGLIFDAHLTPGETKGCTTWTTQVRWGRVPYEVAFVGCRPDKWDELRALKPDVFLASRGTLFDLEGKYARRNEKPNPFIDPQGYRRFVEGTK